MTRRVPWRVWFVSASALVAWVQLLLNRGGDWIIWAVNAATLVACTAAATMRPAHELDPPTPPTNVRLIHPDGTTVPLQCRYRGRDDDGLHLWVAVIAPPLVPGMRLTADELPVDTNLTVVTREGE